MCLAGDVERGAPVAVAVLGKLKIPPLAVHPDRDVADTTPGVEPLVEGRERGMRRCRGQRHEAERRAEEPTAFVVHAPGYDAGEPNANARRRTSRAREVAMRWTGLTLRLDAGSHVGAWQGVYVA